MLGTIIKIAIVLMMTSIPAKTNLFNDFHQALLEAFPQLTFENSNSLSIIAANGSSSFTPGTVLFPKTDSDVLMILDFYLKQKAMDPELAPMVVSGGGRNGQGNLPQGWSFDAHAQGDNGTIVVNTKLLSGLYQDIDWEKDLDHKTGELKVWFYAGTTWQHALELVNNSYTANFPNSEDDFVPIIAPTSGDISLGGSLASNTHARASSVLGGYFADHVETFLIATVRHGHINYLPVSMSLDPDLFRAIVGSFGRGGIVTAIKLKLQRIKKEKDVVTKLRRVASIEDLTQQLTETRLRLIKTGSETSDALEQRPFLGTAGVISSNFKDFYIFEMDLVKTTEDKPAFPLFVPPNRKTEFLYSISRVLPRLAEGFMKLYIGWHSSSDFLDFIFNAHQTGKTAIFHNRPLENYTFFQDGFTKLYAKKINKGYKTGHFTLMLELVHLPVAMHAIQEIATKECYKNITFELQDILPLPKSSILMSSAYSKDLADNTDDEPSLVAYTMSWAINDKNAESSARLQKEIENALYGIQVQGKPLAWLHLTKEFSQMTNADFYRSSAQQLENILDKNGIQDQIFITNRAQQWVYKNSTK